MSSPAKVVDFHHSPARFALNHHTLLRERLRRPNWRRFTTLATRVERLALGDGYTVRLGDEEAERWRVAVGDVAEALAARRYAKNPGPHCGQCPFKVPCQVLDGADGPTF